MVFQLLVVQLITQFVTLVNVVKIVGYLSHYLQSTRQTSVVFHLIHCDILGPSPTPTASGFRYYIIFVDDYSRYTWLYPMKAKSDSVDCFKHFKSMGETLFQGIIIA